MAELDAFVEARQKSIASQLDEAYAVLACPVCQQPALKIDDGVECLFCGYKADGEGAANEYVTNTMGLDRFRTGKDGGEWPIGLCPSCDRMTCVDADAAGCMCFGCGAKWVQGQLDECGRCGRWIDRDDDDIDVCDSCFEEVMRRAD